MNPSRRVSRNLGRFKDTRKQPPCRPRSLRPAASSPIELGGPPLRPADLKLQVRRPPAVIAQLCPRNRYRKTGTAPRGFPGGRSGPAPEYGSNPLSDTKEVSSAKLRFFVRISGVQGPLPVRTSLKPGGTSLNHNEKPLSVRTSLKESGLERDCSSAGSSATSSLADSQTTLPAHSSDSIPAHGWPLLPHPLLAGCRPLFVGLRQLKANGAGLECPASLRRDYIEKGCQHCRKSVV